MSISEGIERAVEKATGGPVSRCGSAPIVETFRGEVIWEGIVDIYDTTKGKAYGWAVQGDDEPQFVTVLGKPPINSALDAVRAWIVSTHRKDTSRPQASGDATP